MKAEKIFCVYIMSNVKHGVLYIGVTSNIEKKLKRWRRDWKFRLIEELNPEWEDLLPELLGHDIIGPLSYLQGR